MDDGYETCLGISCLGLINCYRSQVQATDNGDQKSSKLKQTFKKAYIAVSRESEAKIAYFHFIKYILIDFC